MREMTSDEYESMHPTVRDRDRDRYVVRAGLSESSNSPAPIREIINLCPFDVIIVNRDDVPVLRWGAAKRPAKVLGGRRKVEYDLNETKAPVDTFEYGRTVGLPAPRSGVAYIVTTMVMDKHPERADLLITDSGKDSIRNQQDRVLAVRRLLALNVPHYERR